VCFPGSDDRAFRAFHISEAWVKVYDQLLGILT